MRGPMGPGGPHLLVVVRPASASSSKAKQLQQQLVRNPTTPAPPSAVDSPLKLWLCHRPLHGVCAALAMPSTPTTRAPARRSMVARTTAAPQPP